MRPTAHRALWALMTIGCSSQPFCDFHDTASIVALPMPGQFSGGGGLGSSMLAVTYEDERLRDTVVVGAGAGTQTEGFELALDGKLSVNRSRPFSEICTAKHMDDEEGTCAKRAPGVAHAFIPTWRDGTSCLAVGMEGSHRTGGVGFWCAAGTRHRRDDEYFLPLTSEFERLAALVRVEPGSRLVLGTDRGVYVYAGGGTNTLLATVSWPDGAGLPSAIGSVATLSSLPGEDDADGLIAVAYGNDDGGQVLVGELGPADDTGQLVALQPRWCLQGSSPGFGSVLELAFLEPGGDLYLLVGAAGEVADREPVVDIFAVDLQDPADVECASHAPWITLACDDFDGLDVDCDVEASGFGAAFAVGNIDDTPEAEVVVGCPGATVERASQAGAGYIFRPAREGSEVIEILIDSGLERDHNRLGAGVVIAPVGDREEPVLAAPGERSVLMFLCSGVGDAPPLWDSPRGDGNSMEDQRCRNPDR